MNLSIPIYQVKSGAWLNWITLGLGPLTIEESGRSPIKLQQKVVARLKQRIADLQPAQLETFEMARGVKLERVRLDLTLRGAGGRRKVTGKFPLVIEPRWVNDEQRIRVAYHPERQVALEWFAYDEQLSLEEQASRYFSHAWRDLALDEIEDLESYGKDRLRIIAFNVRPPSVLDKLPEREAGVWDDLDAERTRDKKKKRRRRDQRKLKVLDEVGVDQTVRAAGESLVTGMPRREYRERLQLLLGGKSRRTPALLVGPPGVGKTTLIQRYVADQLEADDFRSHRNLDRVRHVWSVSGKRLIAGMSYLGDWEKRVIELCEDGARDSVTLWIEDVHAWGRLGRSRDSQRNLADLMRGPLARGELSVVAECTPEQLQRLEDDAPSFAALFTQVQVHEPDGGLTLRMMIHEARELELKHSVSFSPFVFRAVLELCDSLFPGAAFPGKALDLLRELARQARDLRVAPGDADGGGAGVSGQGGPRGAAGGDAVLPMELGPEHVISLLSRKTGLPELILKPDAPLTRESVEEQIGSAVIGQHDGVRAASDVILRIRSGLTARRRPYAVYLITGPTGTGKTELAKSLAEYLYGDRARLTRFDMGEFSAGDAVARLIGDRFDPRGLLTDAVRLQPFSVVLLDEIEKAHRTVFNLLLQLFDEGRLTDAAGNTADFTHAVVLMTSNLGARAEAPLGFGDEAGRATAHVKRAVEEFFPPELFNRIDRVVEFGALSREAARRIATKELSALLGRWGLAERNIFVYAGEAPVDRIVREGFDARYGARTVKRYLETHVGALLAAAITRVGRSTMRILRLYEAEDQLELHEEALVEAETRVTPLAIGDVLDAGRLELKERLPGALDYVDTLLADERVEALGQRISDLVERHNAGDAEAGDVIYRLESMRESLRSLRRRMGYHLARPAPDPEQVLGCLAEVEHYRRALDVIDTPDAHAVFLVLSAVGLGSSRQRLGESTVSLMRSMVRAAVSQTFRGELEGFAVRLRDGRIAARDAPSPGVELDAEVDKLLAFGGSDLVVLRLSALGVRDYFADERGCHIWRSLAHGTEVVRVDLAAVHGEANPEGSARTQARLHIDGVKAFNEALERGGELPENPEGLLPAVRQIRFTAPGHRGERAEIEIEDYRLGHVHTARVADIAEALPRLWTLRMSRTE